MRVRGDAERVRLIPLLAALGWVAWATTATAQTPPSIPALPAPAPGQDADETSPAKLLERLRKMEETIKDLREQNKDLEDKYKGLSKEVEENKKKQEEEKEKKEQEEKKKEHEKKYYDDVGQPEREGGAVGQEESRLAGPHASQGGGGFTRGFDEQGVGNRKLGKMPMKANYNYGREGIQLETEDEELMLKFRFLYQGGSARFHTLGPEPGHRWLLPQPGEVLLHGPRHPADRISALARGEL